MSTGLRRKRLSPGIQFNSDINEDSITNTIMSGNDYEEEEEGSSSSSSTFIEKPTGWGTRHTMALLGFLGFVASYAMRVNLSIAIVAMVGNSNSSNDNSTNSSQSPVCPSLVSTPLAHGSKMNLAEYRVIFDNQSGSYQHHNPGNFESNNILLTSPELFEANNNNNNGEFNWNSQQQGIVLGSFFWGYVVTQVPGGMLSERIGGKWPFGIGMLITAIFSLLTPLAARSGMGALIFVRVIQGLGEGVTNPAMHALLARWVPPLERSKFGAYVYAGSQIGTVIAMPVSGLLISSNIFGGWPSVFYVFGIFGIVWFILWTIFVFDTPSSHPRIQAKELSYIQHSLGNQTAKHKVPTPWKSMLTSMPVIAILVAQTGHGWGLYTLLTELPTYMKAVLQFDLKDNSILSAMPYFTMWVVSLIVSWTADTMREANVLSTTNTRKLFNTIAHWGPSLALVGAAYSGCNRVLAIFLLTMAVGINGAHFAAFQVNHIDIAPNHAGVMMGITNGFANLCGIAAPYTAGVIINNGSTLESWRLIFLIAAAIYFVDNIFYLIFASGEEQPWNRDPSDIDGRTDRDPLLASEGSPKGRRKATSLHGYNAR